MFHKHLVDAMTSTDPNTNLWKTRFMAAKEAYNEGKLIECKHLLSKLTDEGSKLPDKTFAVNTSQMGLAAVLLAEGKAAEAAGTLKKIANSLASQSDPALKELYGVALRFEAVAANDQGDFDQAEDLLLESVKVLEDIGNQAAVQLCYTLSDLALLYLSQDDLAEAAKIVTAMSDLADIVFAPDSADYALVHFIYNISQSKNDDEYFSAIEDSITRMSYLRGAKHPQIVWAIKAYLKKLHERNLPEAIKEAEIKFGAVHVA